jgi:4-diphosphocytidyl-2-C-methyl-D-erythritol kinase
MMRRALRARAFAKINLTLRVLRGAAGGYHEIRTVFQTVALHDTLVCTPARGPFELASDDPACPADRTNLVWRAAQALWEAAGRRGDPVGVRVAIRKRIPVQAGLGGGSSDAAAALRALAVLWRVRPDRLGPVAASLGADVPFFLRGGTALGLGRGDCLFPLADAPRMPVVLALPAFGVSTPEAYAWWDRDEAARTGPNRDGGRPGPLGLPDAGNDLEGPVSARHPAIRVLAGRLRRAGASYAAMSGSGSAVFGLFGGSRDAAAAAARIASPTCRTLSTWTLTRASFAALARPR